MLPLREIKPDEAPDIEALIFNLNYLIGYFTCRLETNAADTIHQAEQLIKNLEPAARRKERE